MKILFTKAYIFKPLTVTLKMLKGLLFIIICALCLSLSPFATFPQFHWHANGKL